MKCRDDVVEDEESTMEGVCEELVFAPQNSNTQAGAEVQWPDENGLAGPAIGWGDPGTTARVLAEWLLRVNPLYSPKSRTS
jgi:hypothetical protein